tara:strand:+ start:8275 stop:9891 length:1617 start_codon:yes stop_codon:yes gene_type:complete
MKKLNIIYHFCPIKNNMFDYHIDKLRKYIPKFNNKRVINIAVGDGLYSPEYVKEKLKGLDIQFFETPNNNEYRESYGFFEKLLPTIESTDENEYTFFGHSKSNSEKRQLGSYKKPHRLWTDYCYEYNLSNIDDVLDKLNTYDTYGIFKRTKGLETVAKDSKWHYSGTFFWFKNSEIFKQNWESKKDNGRYGTEAFLGRLITNEKSYCAFDLDGDLGKPISIFDNNSSWKSELDKIKFKKIVMIPVFCESHLVKYQIDNIIDTINPDYIVYNEGMFPRGPESSTIVSDNFISNYTTDGVRGFDYEDMEKIIESKQKEYPNIKIILNKMEYPKNLVDAPSCYTLACSNFEDVGIDVSEGDYIFPLEGDVFHHEDSKEEIEGYLSQLKPNTGFRSVWIDFLETQYYVEKITLLENGRSRKVCLRFGDMDWYKNVLSNFMTQTYPMLYPTDLTTYHYAWWRPGKFKQMRYDQLNRDRAYWDSFNNGLNEIRNSKNTHKNDIVMRPSTTRTDGFKFASFMDIKHPKHVFEHPNYVRGGVNETN